VQAIHGSAAPRAAGWDQAAVRPRQSPRPGQGDMTERPPAGSGSARPDPGVAEPDSGSGARRGYRPDEMEARRGESTRAGPTHHFLFAFSSARVYSKPSAVTGDARKRRGEARRGRARREEEAAAIHGCRRPPPRPRRPPPPSPAVLRRYVPALLPLLGLRLHLIRGDPLVEQAATGDD
jgi:hypothetical protein